MLWGSASLKPWQLSVYLLLSLLLPVTPLRLVRESRGWNKCGKYFCEVLPGLYHSCRKTHSFSADSLTHRTPTKNVDFFSCQTAVNSCSAVPDALLDPDPHHLLLRVLEFHSKWKFKTEMSLRVMASAKPTSVYFSKENNAGIFLHRHMCSCTGT